jgi:hypothetical protein
VAFALSLGRTGGVLLTAPFPLIENPITPFPCSPMSWLKHVWLDLAVTALIVAATVLQQGWAGWAVLVYTPFMLLLKGVAFTGGGLVRPKALADPPPDMFYHLLYAANVLLLLMAGQTWRPWWLYAGMWAAIWLLSTRTGTRPVRTRRDGTAP